MARDAVAGPDTGSAPRGTLDPTMSAVTAPDGVVGTLTVQLREIKLVTERLMMVLGVPRGATAGARQFVVAGCAHDPAGTLDRLARLTDPEPRPMFRAPRFAEAEADTDTDTVTVDSGGTPLLLHGHLVVHHLAGRARSGPYEADLAATGDPATLRTVVRLLRAFSLDVRDLGDGRLAVPAPDGDPRVLHAWKDIEDSLLDGVEVPARTWWQLYYASNRALSVDTAVSRYHTGDTLRRVTAAGERFVRQNDPLGRDSHRREIYVDVS